MHQVWYRCEGKGSKNPSRSIRNSCVDVAVNALKAAIKLDSFDYNELWEMTGVCGVRYIVDRYLEVLGVVEDVDYIRHRLFPENICR